MQETERDHQVEGGCSCERRDVRGFGSRQAFEQVAYNIFAGKMHFFGNIFLTARNERLAIIHGEELPIDVWISMRKKHLEAQVAARDIEDRTR